MPPPDEGGDGAGVGADVGTTGVGTSGVGADVGTSGVGASGVGASGVGTGVGAPPHPLQVSLPSTFIAIACLSRKQSSRISGVLLAGVPNKILTRVTQKVTDLFGSLTLITHPHGPTNFSTKRLVGKLFINKSVDAEHSKQLGLKSSKIMHGPPTESYAHACILLIAHNSAINTILYIVLIH